MIGKKGGILLHCHDVLGITERASSEEIRAAYEKRLQILAASREGLSETGYLSKKSELDLAQEQCTDWQTTEGSDKRIARIAHLRKQDHHSIRLNSVCFGPCTCCNSCGGAVINECMNTGGSIGCCEAMGGEGKLPIICDIILWSPAVIAIVVGVIKALPSAFSSTAGFFRSIGEARAGRARRRLDSLRSELALVTMQREGLEKKLAVALERQRLALHSGYSWDASQKRILSPPSNPREQDAMIEELRLQIRECSAKERELQEEITPLEYLD